jgi:mannose-1-phosphate guanylyltransferase
MYILILAGGVGTRLWPHSRSELPKQLLPLTGDKTMVQTTVDRIRPIVPAENIFFATNQEYGQIIAEQIPDVPRQNILAEPSAKNTAPCIGLAALHMQRLDPNAVMVSLHADHHIIDEEGFRQALLAAEEVAQEGYLVTLGIKPDQPETGYGYVERGEVLGTYNDYSVYRVNRFLEKPDLETAESFVSSGKHYWNSGIFIWKLSTLMAAFELHTPKLFRQFSEIDQAIGTGDPIAPAWEEIDPVSIDVGIMEQAEKVAVIPTDFGWNDVGSWAAIYDVAEQDDNRNVLRGDNIVVVDTKGSYIRGHDRFIAVVGLDDVIVVQTEDALLVCARDKAQDVKEVVKWLQAQERDDLL